MYKRQEQPAPEELEKKLLPRALVYSGSAAVVYLAAYPILNAVSVSYTHLDVYKRQIKYAPYTFFGITIQLSLYAMKTRSARG